MENSLCTVEGYSTGGRKATSIGGSGHYTFGACEFEDVIRKASLRLINAIRCGLMAAVFCLPACAVNPEMLISQYAHSAWRSQDGFFNGSPWAITQTVDGYIWVGTLSGIVRFDGVRFVSWIPPGGERLRTANITALLGARDGSLWIGTDGSDLWHWSNQRLTSYPFPGNSRINSLMEGDKESVWLTRSKQSDSAGPVCEAGRGQSRCYGESSGIPSGCCAALSKDSAGDFWMGGDTALIEWKPRSSQALRFKVSGSVAKQTNVMGIAFQPEGSAWIAVDTPGRGRGLESFFHSTFKPFVEAHWDSSTVGTAALLLDRHHTLWVGTTNQGLYRIRNRKVEHFDSAEGLSGDYVDKIFEDHEGNIWVTTLNGVDCFRDLAVSTFSLREGLGSAEIDTVLASRNGTIWAGGDGALDALRGSEISSLRTGKGLPGIQVTSLFEDHAGRMWVGVDETMSILKDGRFTQIKRPDGRPLGFVVGIAEDLASNVWVEVSGTPRELIRLRNLQVQEVIPAPGMPAARKLAADPKGGIWLGLTSGDIARYRNGKLDTFHFQHQTASFVNEISVNPDGSVLGATGFGLIGWREGKQQILTARNGLPCDSINSFVRDGSDALWLYSQCGLIRISEKELQKWWANAAAVLQMRTYDSADGVQVGLAPFQKAALSTDGKLWFTNQTGLQTIDPSHLTINDVIPPVHVEEVVVDRKTFSPAADLSFAALTRDVAIRYTALSFVAPRKVRFRYKLEGQDDAWQEAGGRREAFYTNLAPRGYRFRVIACNNDGLWNEAGDSISFTIAPAYYQALWFQLLCAVAIGGTLWMLYLLRLKQATDQVQQRLGARLEERERIARELHDTLLQGFQGLMLRFQAVMKNLPEHEPAHLMMEQVLDRADGVLLEGRQRVRDLREEGLSGEELSQALARFGEELSQDHSSRFSLSVLGVPQPLDPVVFNEVARIAREALANAFVHSRASRIEAELTYTRSHVCLRIRDNGTGIDPRVLNDGKAGHWGLSGMRERAHRILAQLKIWSHAGAGTEVELTIPAKIAYPSTRGKSLWGRLINSAIEAEDKTQ